MVPSSLGFVRTRLQPSLWAVTSPQQTWKVHEDAFSGLWMSTGLATSKINRLMGSLAATASNPVSNESQRCGKRSCLSP